MMELTTAILSLLSNELLDNRTKRTVDDVVEIINTRTLAKITSDYKKKLKALAKKAGPANSSHLTVRNGFRVLKKRAVRTPPSEIRRFPIGFVANMALPRFS